MRIWNKLRKIHERMAEETKYKRKPISLGQLFDKHIGADNKVLCIGGYYSPVQDPSVAYAASRARGKEGKTFLLDSQSTMMFDGIITNVLKGGTPAEAQKKFFEKYGKFPSKGDGDPYFHREAIRQLSREGKIALKLPTIRIGEAKNTGLKENEIDVLVDAGTLRWAIKNNQENTQKELKDILTEYQKISKKTVLVFQEPNEKYFGEEPICLENLKKELIELGAKKIDEHRIENKYVFKKTRNIALLAPERKKLGSIDKIKTPWKQLELRRLSNKISQIKKSKKIVLSHKYPYNMALVVEW